MFFFFAFTKLRSFSWSLVNVNIHHRVEIRILAVLRPHGLVVKTFQHQLELLLTSDEAQPRVPHLQDSVEDVHLSQLAVVVVLDNFVRGHKEAGHRNVLAQNHQRTRRGYKQGGRIENIFISYQFVSFSLSVSAP